MGASGGKRRRTNRRHNTVRLSATAIIEGWDVPLETRPKVIEELKELAFGDDVGTREKLRAMEALMKFPGMQIDAARLQIEQQKWKRDKGQGTAGLAATVVEADAIYEAEHGSGQSGEVPQ